MPSGDIMTVAALFPRVLSPFPLTAAAPGVAKIRFEVEGLVALIGLVKIMFEAPGFAN